MSNMYYDWDAQPVSHQRWMELFTQPRRVAYTDLGQQGRVSTVWLGLNHGYPPPWGDDTRPLIYETMVFGGPLADEMLRYTTLGQARTGHQFMVMRLTSLAGATKARPLIHNGGKPRR
jgi:hypothetical protein